MARFHKHRMVGVVALGVALLSNLVLTRPMQAGAPLPSPQFQKLPPPVPPISLGKVEAVPEPEPVDEEDDVFLLEPPQFEATDLPPFETTTVADTFSIKYPQGWQVVPDSATSEIRIYQSSESSPASESPENIETEVKWLPLPPAEVVPQGLANLQTEGYGVLSYYSLAIDYTTAIQVWLTDVPNGPPHGLLTYVGYEDATAILFSRYSQKTPEIEAQLQAMHNSFSRVDAASSVGGSPAAEEAQP